MFSHIKKYYSLIIIGILFLLTSFVWYRVYTNRVHPLRFIMLDVGQGDALFIEAPNGNRVLIDGGAGDVLLSQVGRVMPFFDRDIDLLINTNPDKDHFEGFIPLLDRYSVGAFMESGTLADGSSLWVELKKKIKNKGIAEIVARRGQRIVLGDEVYIDILFPDRDIPNVSHNDGSIVAQLVYKGTKVMLTGDSTTNIEKYLIGLDGERLDSDILKAGHHGSKTSTGEEFLKEVSPNIVLISAGKGNSYGHPSSETVEVLEKNKIPYLVTMDEGMIVFESDGQDFVRVK